MSLACPAVEIRVYDSPSAFDLLAEEWKSLFHRHGGWNVFLSWQWFREWWAAFGAESEPRIVALRRHGRLAGLVPAMVEPDGRGGRRLALIGSDRTTDYGDLLAEPEAVEPLCEALADLVADSLSEHGQVRMHGIPPWSPLLRPFREAVRRRGLVTGLHASDTCPVARLAPTWDEYLATLGKHDRHELRRKIRRAAAAGQQEMLFLAEPGEVAAGLDAFFRLHRLSHPEKARFLDEQMAGFFHGVAAAFSREGWLRLNLMWLDGRAVAGSISFCREERTLLYNSGLDPEYRVHSVGIALHAAEIQQAIEHGKSWYDFLRGNEPYKYALGGRDSPICTLTVLPEGAGDGDHGDARG